MPIHGLMAAFSEALAPLIESSIQMMYLGITGWIGSTLTMREITVLSQVKLKLSRRFQRGLKQKLNQMIYKKFWKGPCKRLDLI